MKILLVILSFSISAFSMSGYLDVDEIKGTHVVPPPNIEGVVPKGALEIRADVGYTGSSKSTVSGNIEEGTSSRLGDKKVVTQNNHAVYTKVSLIKRFSGLSFGCYGLYGKSEYGDFYGIGLHGAYSFDHFGLLTSVRTGKSYADYTYSGNVVNNNSDFYSDEPETTYDPFSESEAKNREFSGGSIGFYIVPLDKIPEWIVTATYSYSWLNQYREGDGMFDSFVEYSLVNYSLQTQFPLTNIWMIGGHATFNQTRLFKTLENPYVTGGFQVSARFDIAGFLNRDR